MRASGDFGRGAGQTVASGRNSPANRRRRAGFAGLGWIMALVLGLASGVRAGDRGSIVRAGPKDTQELFATAQAHELRIEVPPAEIDLLKKDARLFARATVWEGTTVYKNVGIHLKGSAGSFRNLDDKPALTLNFGRFTAEQRFHGLRKIHLNNSVQDSSFLNENLAGGMFRAAGVPAARVAYALVEFNGRSLGPYVLKEGFTRDFLKLYFKKPTGNLYDMEPGREVTAQLKKDYGEGPNDWSDLQRLAAAASEPDPTRLWSRLHSVLDVDRFLSFMALEVMTCHWDGYCLGRNNFRVYHDMDTDKMLFFPHGMDQMFGAGSAANAPLRPGMNGLVAQAILKTAEGRRQYRSTCATLFTNIFKVEVLTNRIHELARQLRPMLPDIDNQAAAVRQRIIERAADLQRQLNIPEPTPLPFTQGLAKLAGWRPEPAQGDAHLDQLQDADGRRTLHISTHAVTVASWRAKVLLDEGRYRLEGSARTAGVVATRDERKGEGAGLRISGATTSRSNHLSGDSSWQKLTYEFAVPASSDEVDFVCELRASAGEVWFDADSLQLVKLP